MPPRPVARRMTTRSSNANTRPGLVQVQANHQVARDRKERPAGDSEDTDASERRAAAVRRIADLEHDIMEEDTDDFLKAPPQKPTKKRQHRERSSSVVTGIEAEAPTPPPEGETDVEIDTPMPKRRGSKPKKIPFREAVRHFQEEDNLDATDVEKTPQHTVKSNAPKRLLRARESTAKGASPAKRRRTTRTALVTPKPKAKRASVKQHHVHEEGDSELDLEMMSTVTPKPTSKRQQASECSQRLKTAKDSLDNDESMGDDETRATPEDEAELSTKARKRADNATVKNVVPEQSESQEVAAVPQNDKGNSISHKKGRGGDDFCTGTTRAGVTSLPKKVMTAVGNNLKRTLTLDPVTLFFYNLSRLSQQSDTSESEHHHVANWAKKTLHPDAKQKKRSQGGLSRATLVSSRSALEGNVAIRVGQGGDNDRDDHDSRGLSDHDEMEGEEHNDAKNSPLKPSKSRVDNKGIVTVKRGRQARVKNDDLPQVVLASNNWRSRAVTTLYMWFGFSSDPWNVGDHVLCAALSQICHHLYGDLDLGLDEDDDAATPAFTRTAAFRIALQRSSEWRSSFGSAAIAVTCAYFDDETHAKMYATDEAQAEFTENQLSHYRFVYKRADGNSRKHFKGAFQGPLIGPILATHFTAISGASNVPGLCPVTRWPVAALALAVAALERALKLWKDKNLLIASVKAAKMTGKSIVFNAPLNPANGKKASRPLAFSDEGWGAATRAYIRSTEKLSNGELAAIFENAKEFAKVTGPSGSKSSQGETNLDDERAFLVNGDESDDSDVGHSQEG